MTIEEIVDYVRHTPGNTNPNVLKTLLQDVSSGGGSSDFSIATITMVNSTEGDLDFILPCIEQEVLILDMKNIASDSSDTFDIPLYKGSTLIYPVTLFGEISDPDISTPPEFILTGDIQFDTHLPDAITIYGNGTIEVKTEKGPDPT